jgi:hypothetical protein
VRVRAQVRDAQRAVAALHFNFRHAAEWVEHVLARRAAVLTDQGGLVAAPQAAAAGQVGPADRKASAVAEMANRSRQSQLPSSSAWSRRQ